MKKLKAFSITQNQFIRINSTGIQHYFAHTKKSVHIYVYIHFKAFSLKVFKHTFCLLVLTTDWKITRKQWRRIQTYLFIYSFLCFPVSQRTRTLEPGLTNRPQIVNSTYFLISVYQAGRWIWKSNLCHPERENHPLYNLSAQFSIW